MAAYYRKVWTVVMMVVDRGVVVVVTVIVVGWLVVVSGGKKLHLRWSKTGKSLQQRTSSLANEQPSLQTTNQKCRLKYPSGCSVSQGLWKCESVILMCKFWFLRGIILGRVVFREATKATHQRLSAVYQKVIIISNPPLPTLLS